MKPRFLAFRGINSFSEPAEIDFLALSEFGIFGIFGDTGSGKSTILDCIAFALYGSVSRSRAGSIADIINYKCDEAYVRFEFEIVYGGKRRIYSVERTLKRKNASQSVAVYEREGEKLAAVSAGYREANAFLQEVVGLEQKDFEKCIALPQGEFAQFVKAQRGDRLKLVSRLFDLDRYGERLAARVKEETRSLATEGEVLKARLAPYADITQEATEALGKEIADLVDTEKRYRGQIASDRARERELSARLEKKREAVRIAERLAMLEARRDEMTALGGDLSRLEKASAVIASAEEGKRLRAQCVAAESRAAEATARFARAEAAYQQLSEQSDDALDAEIERLMALATKARSDEELRRRKAQAEARLAEIREKTAAEERAFCGFDYLEKRKALEEKLSALGEENFFDFAEEHGKAALLRGEYAVFAGELNALTEKYPVIAADSKPLAEKYLALAQGEQIDFAGIRAAYEERESAKKALREELVMLEKARGKEALHRQLLTQLAEESSRLGREIADYAGLLLPQPVSADEISSKLKEARAAKTKRAEERAAASKEYADARALHAAAQGNAANAAHNLEAGKARYRECLAAGAFENVEEAAALVKKYGDASDARLRYEKFRDEYAAVLARSKELAEAETDVSEELLAEVRAQIAQTESAADACAKRLAVAEAAYARCRTMLVEKAELEKSLSALTKRYECYEKLKKLIENNQFMEFVAEEYLQTVAVNAGSRLISLTGGRYFLRYDKGFYVGDNFNGGALRGVYTLSGGETFLVSLSLALALGSEICARSLRPIEFFFLDEGFGTLDEKLVDTVMDSLEKLKSEKLTVGIISHVSELKHRIDRKLTVIKATEERGSVIEK